MKMHLTLKKLQGCLKVLIQDLCHRSQCADGIQARHLNEWIFRQSADRIHVRRQQHVSVVDLVARHEPLARKLFGFDKIDTSQKKLYMQDMLNSGHS